MIKKYNFKKISIAVLALILVYLISYLMLKGAGAPRAFFHTMLMVFLITLGGSSRNVFWFIVFPLSVIYALYAPIGITFGTLTYDFLIATFATDGLEATEFFHQIPYKNYLYPIIIIIGLIIYRKIIAKYHIQFFRNRTFIALSVIILASAQAPTHLIRQFSEHLSTIREEQQALKASIKEQSWEEATLLHSNYNNYILIIGESARKDYHHAYGYPINNTPFMSNANGILIDGLTSGGTTTVPSLKAMLTLSNKENWDADYTKTIIGLAKAAGIKTYWISNQGYLGSHDTPISAIATASDNSSFIKKGSYGSINSSDFELLPIFEEVIKNDPLEKKLIILHLYGSHPNACDRISDHKQLLDGINPYYNYLNCYISSIHKTDLLLEKIISFMNRESEKTDMSYSLLYFADHGHTHAEINNELYFNNSRIGKYHYDIPLFMTASDITTRKKCNTFKSGLNFTNGLANWLGIQNQFLDPSYSLFDCKDDPDDFGLFSIIKGKIDDPAIDITPKK